MKTKIISYAMIFLCVSFLITSCKKDNVNPGDSNEEELITTVQLKIKETGTNTINTFIWKDVDGAGGNAPLIQTIALSPNKSYEVEAVFLDESKSPAADISKEVRAEADDHEVFYQTSNAFATITRTDKDSNNFQIGRAHV